MNDWPIVDSRPLITLRIYSSNLYGMYTRVRCGNSVIRIHIYCVYIYLNTSIYHAQLIIYTMGYLNVSNKLEQLLEVGDTESSCRIPALGRVPESAWNNTRLDRISFDAYKEI